MFYKIIDSLIKFAREKTDLAINVYIVCLIIVLLLIGVISLGTMPIETTKTNLIVPESVEIEESLLQDTVNRIEVREENFSKILEKEYQDLFNLEEVADVDSAQID